MEFYKAPESELIDNKNRLVEVTRPLWLMILLNIYFWPKFIDYADRYFLNLTSSSLFEIFTMSINIPVYLSGIFLIFRIKIPPRVFWKIWILLAILDEIRAQIVDYSGISDLIIYIGLLMPLYFIGYAYAFGSDSLWGSPKRYGRIVPYSEDIAS